MKNNSFDNILQAIFFFNLQMQFQSIEKYTVSEKYINRVITRKDKITGKIVDKFIAERWEI